MLLTILIFLVQFMIQSTDASYMNDFDNGTEGTAFTYLLQESVTQLRF